MDKDREQYLLRKMLTNQPMTREEAWESTQAYENMIRGLKRLVHYRTQGKGSVQDTEDCVTQAITRLLEVLKEEKQEKPIRNVASWLYKVVQRNGKNLLYELIDNAKRLVPLDSKELNIENNIRFSGYDNYPSLDGTEMTDEQINEVKDFFLPKILDHLSQTDRAMIQAFYIDGMPVKEIAKREQVKICTVYKRIQNAKRHAIKAYKEIRDMYLEKNGLL